MASVESRGVTLEGALDLVSVKKSQSLRSPSSWEVMDFDRELLELVDAAVELVEERD